MFPRVPTGWRMRWREAGKVFALCVLAAPAAGIVTMVLRPLWSWIEARYGIEAVGHSRPAGWCYLAIYVVLVAGGMSVWRLGRRRP